VLDFFQIDSELISPLASVDLAMLVAEALVHPGEVEDLAAFGGMSTETAQKMHGPEALIQLIGRAELRALTKSIFTAVTWMAGICKASC